MNDLQHEILAEIKDLAVAQATLSTKLDSYLECQTKLEVDVIALKEGIKDVSKHDFILKGTLWLYGIILSAFIYKIFSK